jgi:hypothetical protein
VQSAWRGANKSRAKALFGSPCRILLATWVLERNDEPFYLKEAQRALGDFGEADSATGAAIDSFVDHGMLMRTPDQNKVYFSRVDSPLWTAYETIGIALELTSAPAKRS